MAPGATPAVTVEIFEDVQCPHCQTFTERVEPLLIAEHVESGTASLTYRDFVIFGDDSTDAAVAMRAADVLDGKFWDYHHTLYPQRRRGTVHAHAGWRTSRSRSGSIGMRSCELLDDEELRDGGRGR